MAKRHNKQSFDVSGGVTPPIDALRGNLLAGTGPFAGDVGKFGVELTGADSVTIAVSAPTGETVEAGTLEAFVYAPVNTNDDGSIQAQRWCAYGVTKSVPVAVRDGVVLFNRNELPGVGRLVCLPSGVAISSGTSVQLTYTARRRES